MTYKKLDLKMRYKNLGILEHFSYHEKVRLENEVQKVRLENKVQKVRLEMRYFLFIATKLSRNVRLGCIKSGSSLTMVRLEMRYKS